MSPGRKGMALAAVQGIGTICGCLLALLTALSLTLFREGFYLDRLHDSDCVQGIYENIQQGARTVAEAAGLRGDILEELVTPEAVDVAVVRRADTIWHGSTEQPESPYAGTVAYLEDTVSRETGILWSESDENRYKSIQLICDDMWRTNTVAPLSNLLNLLMQYRRVAWALMAVLAVLLLLCRGMISSLCRDARERWDTVFGLGLAVFVGCALAMGVIGLSGWQNWMPDSDPGYKLYREWMGAVGPVLTACGSGLAALVWITGLRAYGISRGLIRRQGKTPLSASGSAEK